MYLHNKQVLLLCEHYEKNIDSYLNICNMGLIQRTLYVHAVNPWYTMKYVAENISINVYYFIFRHI